MIDDLDATIEELLRTDLQTLRETLEAENEAQRDALATIGEITFSFQQPKSGWNTTAQSGLVLNLFLYDVRENAQLRRHYVDTLANGNNADPRFVQQKRLPMRIDCFYMVTAWHDEPRWQHWLLASALQILGRHAVLPETYLLGNLRNQPFEIRTKVAAHDVLTNPAEVWSALGNDMRPSFSYVVTLAIDPWQPISVPVVRTVVTMVGQKVAPPSPAPDSDDADNDPLAVATNLGRTRP
ncbi:MAG: DUF4255 domain-containing protein [Caldilinea sp. CFX5]|nr:DUF4255 domain-containing protein [Caldilinea sp. CFX5]